MYRELHIGLLRDSKPNQIASCSGPPKIEHSGSNVRKCSNVRKFTDVRLFAEVRTSNIRCLNDCLFANVLYVLRKSEYTPNMNEHLNIDHEYSMFGAPEDTSIRSVIRIGQFYGVQQRRDTVKLVVRRMR